MGCLVYLNAISKMVKITILAEVMVIFEGVLNI
jgi:hypothetical protein